MFYFDLFYIFESTWRSRTHTIGLPYFPTVSYLSCSELPYGSDASNLDKKVSTCHQDTVPPLVCLSQHRVLQIDTYNHMLARSHCLHIGIYLGNIH